MWYMEATINVLNEKITKNSFKNSFLWKDIFEQKDIQSLNKVTLLAPMITIWHVISKWM